MTLLFRLRWSVALFICPELRAAKDTPPPCGGADRRFRFSPDVQGETVLAACETMKATAARAWAGFQSAEDIEAWLEGASEAELDAMAEHFLVGRLLSHGELALQQQILLVSNAREKHARLVTEAVGRVELRAHNARFLRSQSGECS